MDGLRGIAVLMVFLFHGNEQGLLNPSVQVAGLTFELPRPLMLAGGLGVEIFFFISGFVLMYPLARGVFDGRPAQTLRDYFNRRALKIVPSYVLALTVFALFVPMDVPPGASLLWQYVAHLTFAFGFSPKTFGTIAGPFWTLAIEAEFYVLFPLVARFFVRWPERTLAAMIAVTIPYHIAMHASGLSHDFFWSDQLPDFLDIFGAGMYAAWTIVRFGGRVRSAVEQRRWTTIGIACVVVFYGMLGQILTTGGADSWEWSNDHRDLEALVLFVFAIGTAFGVETWRAALSNRFLLYFSTISYNLYLWHNNIYSWYHDHWYGFVMTTDFGPFGTLEPSLIAISLPIAVASAVTYLFERPILAKGWGALFGPTVRAVRSLFARLPERAKRAGEIAGAGTGVSSAAAPFAAFLAFLVPLVLFANSMRHVAGGSDANELVTVSYVLGIAHPPSFPLAVGVGWLVTHLVPIGWVAWRVVLVSTISSAIAAALLARVIRALGGEAWIAMASACVFATGAIVWAHATDASFEPLALALFAASVEALVAYTRYGKLGSLARAGICAGLGASVHPIVLFLVPGIALVAATRDGRALSRHAALAVAIALGTVATGLLPYALVPARAVAIAAWGPNPLRDLGKPPSEAIWNYDDPTTPAAFFRLVTAADYGPPEFLTSWSDARNAPGRLASAFWIAAGQLGVIPLVLSGFGFALVTRRRAFLGIVLLGFGTLPAFTAAGFRPNQDIDVYAVFGIWIATVFLGVATTAIVRGYGQSLRVPRRATAIATLAIGSIGAGVSQHFFVDQKQIAPDPIVDRVRSATGANAIVIAPWSEALPLAEATYAERTLGERTIDPAFITEEASRLGAWTKTRPVYALAVPLGYSGADVRLHLVAGEPGAFDAVDSVAVMGPPAP